jgi:hypothetical protein
MSIEDKFSDVSATSGIGADQFKCSKCQLVKHLGQVAKNTTGGPVCEDCASTSAPAHSAVMKAADAMEPYMDATAANLSEIDRNQDDALAENNSRMQDLKLHEGAYTAADIPSPRGGRAGFPASAPVSGGEMSRRLEREKAGDSEAWKGGAPRVDAHIDEPERKAWQARNAALYDTHQKGIKLRTGKAAMSAIRDSFLRHEADHAKVNPDGATSIAACENQDCADNRAALKNVGIDYKIGHFFAHHGGEGTLIGEAAQNAVNAELAHPRNEQPAPISLDHWHTDRNCQYWTRLYQLADMTSDDKVTVEPREVRSFISQAAGRTRTNQGRRVGVKKESLAANQPWFWNAGNTSTVEASKGPWGLMRQALNKIRLHDKEHADVDASTLKYPTPAAKAARKREITGARDHAIKTANQVKSAIQAHALALRASKKSSTTDSAAAAGAVGAVLRESIGQGEGRAKGSASGTIADDLAANGDQTAKDSGTITDAGRLVPKARVGLKKDNPTAE